MFKVKYEIRQQVASGVFTWGPWVYIDYAQTQEDALERVREYYNENNLETGRFFVHPVNGKV